MSPHKHKVTKTGPKQVLASHKHEGTKTNTKRTQTG